ncbi:DUF1819 family protein [uncultured Methanobrevibacter sp.]|uniref:DUF1819 family protein n=1 Tax=uncultured Methanobrevibacter sp. TaxID=253161 RepID=UPI0026032018
MKYSAGLVSNSFWFIESRKVAELMLEGYSKEEIMDLALKENIFQVETESRVKEVTNGIFRRLSSFSEDVLEYFLRTDTNSAKVFVLISVLKQDKLFFEFMYEVFREHIVLGDFTLRPKDFDKFFDEKSYQSEEVSQWREETVERLKRGYKNMLSEAGVLESAGNEREIYVPFVDLRLKNMLIENDLGPYYYSITGEKV